MKRMTLLARRMGLSTSDFRDYWAGPHANLALCMPGITHYVHNRVDKVLWSADAQPAFDIDGIVELTFANATAMQAAQASDVGNRFIPEDEPNFLRGWTLCLVESEGNLPSAPSTKVLVPFHAPQHARAGLWSALRAADAPVDGMALNWTTSHARRPGLWAEPQPPTGFVELRFADVASAHRACCADAPLCLALEAHASDASAYLIDELRLR